MDSEMSSEAPRKLGQLLVERQQITGEQLIRAIQSQRRVGGRLGTCLLEMEVLTEEELLAALSGQLGVPAIRIEQLRNIDEGVLRLVPPAVARRSQAVPFSASDSEVALAMLDVRNLRLLDELAFCAGRKVRPHIANEARVFEALEKYYRVECPRRYGHLLDRLNRRRYLWAKGAEPGDGDGEPDGACARRLRDEQTSNVRIQDLVLQDADRLLAEETDRERIGQILLRCLRPVFRRRALFKIRQREVFGWLAEGDEFDLERFRALRLRLDEPSNFFNFVHGADYYFGPLPPMPIHLALARSWGGSLPSQCLMIPLRVRGRLISTLYGDRGGATAAAGGHDPTPLADFDPEIFVGLAKKAEAALERCILQRKVASVS